MEALRNAQQHDETAGRVNEHTRHRSHDRVDDDCGRLELLNVRQELHDPEWIERGANDEAQFSSRFQVGERAEIDEILVLVHVLEVDLFEHDVLRHELNDEHEHHDEERGQMTQLEEVGELGDAERQFKQYLGQVEKEVQKERDHEDDFERVRIALVG